MGRAGYDPGVSIKLWSLLDKLQHDSAPEKSYFCIQSSPLLKTHPTGSDRVEVRLPIDRPHASCLTLRQALLKELPKAVKLYDRSAKALPPQTTDSKAAQSN